MSSDANRPDAPRPRAHPIFNWTSGAGAALASISLAAAVFFLLIGLFERDGSSYSGLTMLPPLALALVGGALFVAGWVIEARRQRRGQHSSFYDSFVVDPFLLVRGVGPLVLLVILAGGTFALLGAGAASVAVVEYTESNAFCTEACHAVMGPEAAAHQDTAHARIECVKCHVGPGAEGYLAAKLGGLRQLYAVATGEISRPIPTPIHGGPLSRELCESCHQPERDVAYQTLARRYFLADEDVTPVQLAMVVKVGSGSEGLLSDGGIHYHMQLSRKVEYAARDAQRQEIVFVRVTEPDGTVREYRNEADPPDDAELASLERHTMQCIDCHSRPAHRFASPIDSVNRLIGEGDLSRKLPEIKEVAVRALDGGYATTDEALAAIGTRLHEFYDDEYPEVAKMQADALTSGIESLRAVYRQTIFPEMKADWKAHPDNAGHRDSPGCFRCHNDEMVDEDGEAVFSDCMRCHAILAQDNASIRTIDDFALGRDFVHPEDFDTIEEYSACSDCHDGGAALYE